MHKAKGNERGEGQCYWALGVAYASIDQLQQVCSATALKPETWNTEHGRVEGGDIDG